MSDDLVKRLRDKDNDEPLNELLDAAADRIEKLEAALREPTLPMLLAGKKNLYSCSEDPEIEDARACFLAMARKTLDAE